MARKVSKTSSELQDLLSRMLEVNPYFRPTAAELLQMPVFDSVRVQDIEKPCKKAFVLA